MVCVRMSWIVLDSGSGELEGIAALIECIGLNFVWLVGEQSPAQFIGSVKLSVGNVVRQLQLSRMKRSSGTTSVHGEFKSLGRMRAHFRGLCWQYEFVSSFD